MNVLLFGAFISMRSHYIKKIEDIQPYGCLSIATYCKNHSKKLKNIKVVPLLYQDMMSTFKKCKKDLFKPDIIGLSFAQGWELNQENSILNIIYQCERFFGPSYIIMGGSAQYDIKSLYDIKMVDGFCFGEGEVPTCEFIDAEDKKKYLSETPYWYTYEKFKNNMPYSNYILEDLDSVGTIDYELMNSFDKNKIKKIIYTMSYGCNHNCSFCAIKQVHGNKKRSKNVDNILNDIEYYVNNYPSLEEIAFSDDYIDLNNKDTKKVFNFLYEKGLRMREHSIFLFFSNFSEENAILMKKLGRDFIVFTIDACSENSFYNLANKSGKFNTLKEAIDNCHKVGLAVSLILLAGYPGEKAKDIMGARKFFIEEMGADNLNVGSIVPIKGTKVYEDAKRLNVLGDFMQDIENEKVSIMLNGYNLYIKYDGKNGTISDQDSITIFYNELIMFDDLEEKRKEGHLKLLKLLEEFQQTKESKFDYPLVEIKKNAEYISYVMRREYYNRYGVQTIGDLKPFDIKEAKEYMKLNRPTSIGDGQIQYI